MSKKVTEEKNKGGRPFGSVGRRKSKLRETAKRLHEMNAEAIQIIQDSLDGKEVKDEVLSTAKWVITTTVQVNKAAVDDEKTLNSDFYERAKAAQEALQGSMQEESKEEDGNKLVKFSLTRV